MATVTENLLRIQEAKQIIQQKLKGFGLVSDSDNINTCAAAIESINDLGELQYVVDNETAETYVLPAGYLRGGTVVVKAVIHCYFNGLKLPKLPIESIKAYPYCWIRDNGSTGNYDLIMGTTSFYYDQSNTRLKHRGSDADLWYRLPKSTAASATSWGSPVSHSYVGWTVDSNRIAYWSNHDVTRGESSTTIYLTGTKPVPIV